MVDNGFDKSSTADLQARLKPLIRKTQPYAKRSRIAAPSGQENGLAPAGGAVCAGTMASTSGYSGNRLSQIQQSGS
jgi:hypothetical protein